MTELILAGRVQGVFCRYYCSQNAKRLGLRGSASNLADGTVQVIIDTDDDGLIGRYTDALRQNPYGVRFWGKIERVSVTRNYTGGGAGDYNF